jgi:hypothetical protein
MFRRLLIYVLSVLCRPTFVKILQIKFVSYRKHIASELLGPTGGWSLGISLLFVRSHSGHASTVCVKMQKVLSWKIVTRFVTRFVIVTETQPISWADCFRYHLDEIRKPGFVLEPFRVKFVVDKMALMEVFSPRTSVSSSQYHSISVSRDRVVGIMIRVRAGLTEK